MPSMSPCSIGGIGIVVLRAAPSTCSRLLILGENRKSQLILTILFEYLFLIDGTR